MYRYSGLPDYVIDDIHLQLSRYYYRTKNKVYFITNILKLTYNIYTIYNELNY